MSPVIIYLNKAKDGSRFICLYLHIRLYFLAFISIGTRIIKEDYDLFTVCFPVLQHSVFKIKMEFELEILSWLLKNQKRKLPHNEYNTLNTTWWYVCVWLCIYTCMNGNMHIVSIKITTFFKQRVSIILWYFSSSLISWNLVIFI